MKPREHSLSLSLGAALAASLAACGGGDDRCDPDAPNTICTIAGMGEHGFSGDGGPATEAMLYAPMDIALSPDGELWVLDFQNFLVRAIDAKGNIRTVVGNGEFGDSPPPDVPSSPALDGPLHYTSDLLFHGDYLYLTGWMTSRVKRVRLSDMMLENYAGRGRRAYYDGDGGPALMASLDQPAAIAFDPAGNLAIMDQQNQVVRRVDGSGTIQRIVGTCVVDLDPPCAPGEQPVACSTLPKFAGSNKLACGDLDRNCGRICGPGFAGDGGPALEARMAQPYGGPVDPGGHLVYDHAGNLLFADTDNHRIRKVDTAGIITTIAGTGAYGYAGDGGPATQAQLNEPTDLELAPDGTIYFTDVNNNCVRKIDPEGIISAVVGQCGAQKVYGEHELAGDGGPPLEAKLNRPHGIHLAGKKLYVSDTSNHRIRVVNLP